MMFYKIDLPQNKQSWAIDFTISDCKSSHHYYFDRNFVNIPKCASTSLLLCTIDEFKKFLVDNTLTASDKFTIVRHPTSRLRSCFKNIVGIVEYDKSTSWESQLITCIDKIGKILLGEQPIPIDDQHLTNEMMHFIPQTFFIENSFLIDKRRPLVFRKLENIIFDINHNPGTDDSLVAEITEDWINRNTNFVEEFYQSDFQMYDRV